MRDHRILTAAELAQSHALYTQGMKPIAISDVLNTQRIHDKSAQPVVKPATIANLAYIRKWAKDRDEYFEKQDETVATALEQLKAEAGNEMVVIIKQLHNTFLTDLRLLDDVRDMFKKAVPTSRELLDLMRASESLQKRLFSFHALRSTPIASSAIPVESVSVGSEIMGGGEVVESAA